MGPLLVAAPGLVLGVAGLFHPHHLTYDTAGRWFALHVAGLVVFPLVGVALAWLVHGRRDPLAWVVRISAYGYATFYSALDVISGIAAGYVTREMGEGYVRDDEVRLLFRIGTPLGEVGSWCLLAAALAVTVDAVRRLGLPGAPTAVMLVGAYLVHTDHIFAPLGALGMVLVGLGTGWVVYASGEFRWRVDATSGTVEASY